MYQKLYRYLDTALSVGTRKSARPSRNPESRDTPTSSPAKPKTPSKAKVIATTTPRSRREERNAIVTEVPPWVMKAIRSLCKGLDAPAASPHVFAGVSSILTVPSPTENLIPNSELVHLRGLDTAALIVAVYLFVRARLSGEELAEKDYERQRNQAIETLSLAHTLCKDCDPQDVDEWMREISSRGWAELDWFQNVGVGAGLGVERSNEEEGQSDADEDDGAEMLMKERIELDSFSIEKPYLQAGLGTMVCTLRSFHESS